MASRCIHCSYPKERHHEGLCPSGSNSYATMDLPPGKTCADCRHVKRCCGIFGAKPENTSCDFWPVRFSAREVPDAN